MSRTPRRAALLALVVAVSGCSEGRYGLELSFEEGVVPADVRHVEVSVREGQCPAPTDVLAGVAPTGTLVAGVGLSQGQASALPSLGELEPGTYAIYARGFDASCQAIAAGCSVYSVKRGGSRTLAVTLGATTPMPGCTGGICSDGACAREDGGVVDDGGMQVDACQNHPCPISQFCTDMPGNAPDSEAGRTCSAVIDCGAGQYEFTAPTATSNRVCASCAECSGTQYASTQCANGNIPQNRVCTLLSTCGAGQYESTPPTPTSDRVCGQCHASCPNCDGPDADDCVECPPDFYSSGGNCLPVTNCGAGQRAQSNPSPTTDRVCVACATCTNGEYASTQCANGNGSQDRICETCTGCSGAQYETTACANGNGAQNRVCTPLTNCGTGQHQDTAPTATTDRTCAACMSCGANQRQTTACANGNGSQDRVCSMCTACTANEYETAACANGNGTQDRDCDTLTSCGVNQRQTVAPTATTDRMCGSCMSCGANQYETGMCPSGNTTTDRTCGTCMSCGAGQFASTQCANGNVAQNRVCMTCTTCGSGQYASTPCADGNASQDRVCMGCATCNGSQYESAPCTSTQNRMCTAITNCGVNQRQTMAPTATTDRQCTLCTACMPTEHEITPCANGNTSQNRVCAPNVCTLTSIADGYVRNGAAATTNAPELRTTDNGPTWYYTFLRFNVASGACAEGGTIPAGATITGATLELRYLTESSCTCSPGHNVHRVTSSWTEASLPASVGAPVSGTVSATFSMPGSKPATVSVTGPQLIMDVQSFLDTPANDFGFRLSKSAGSTGSGEYYFGSRRNTTASNRPRLVITYTLP